MDGNLSEPMPGADEGAPKPPPPAPLAGMPDESEDLPSDDDILKQFVKRAKDSKTASADWRAEAKDIYEFDAGRQWDEADEATLKELNRPCVTFNLFSKFIDAVVGLQINNRQEARCYPRQPGTAQRSEMADAALDWTRDLSSAIDVETDATRDLALVGMGWVEWFLDDDTRPHAFINCQRRDPLLMRWDTTASRRNLLDAKFVIRDVPMSVDEFRDMFPDADAMPADDPGQRMDVGLDALAGGNPQVIPPVQDYDGKSDPGSQPSTERPLLVFDYQWWEVERCVKVNVEGLGQSIMTKAQWAALEPTIKYYGLNYRTEQARQRRYFRAWMRNGEVLKKLRLPSTRGFTYKAMTGKRDHNERMWVGLGRAMMDPNRWVNKFFSSMIWILSVNPKGGLLIEEGAAPPGLEDSWANPSAVTKVRDGAIQQGKLKEKPMGSYPSGLDALMSFAVNALPQTSGLNMEIMGMADRVQPGIVETQRKQSALAIIAWLFDALRIYYRESGELCLEMIARFLANGQLIRVMGPKGAEYKALTADALPHDFDLVVSEAPTSANMQERVWITLKEIAPMFLQAGRPIPPEAIDYTPLPVELAQKFKDAMQPSPQEQQQQQQQRQVAERAAAATIEKDATAAALNTAKADQAKADAEYTRAVTPGEAAEAEARAGRTMAGE